MIWIISVTYGYNLTVRSIKIEHLQVIDGGRLRATYTSSIQENKFSHVDSGERLIEFSDIEDCNSENSLTCSFLNKWKLQNVAEWDEEWNQITNGKCFMVDSRKLKTITQIQGMKRSRRSITLRYKFQWVSIQNSDHRTDIPPIWMQPHLIWITWWHKEQVHVGKSQKPILAAKE